jgi:hypothetical protein
MLEPSRKYLNEIQEEANKKLKEEADKRKAYEEFKKNHLSPKALSRNTFREFQELGETAGIYRSKLKLPHISLEPNHSHFIFADDGSMEFGTDAKLRADVESCVAGIFRGVGVKQTGAGGKILRRIDDWITVMLLKDKQSKGWENADMPIDDWITEMLLLKDKKSKGRENADIPPEQNTECNTTKIYGCKNMKCLGFFWGDSLHQTDQRLCEFCLRDDAIKKKLQESKSAFESIPRVSVMALKHSFSHPQPIKIEINQTLPEISKEIERHRDVLESLRSTEYLDSNLHLDLYDRAQKEKHHTLCIELLELHRKETKCFEVESRDEVLGYFHGTMPELLTLIKNVQKDIQGRMNKTPKMLKKEKPKISMHRERPVPHEVPMVCVCVQGGPGTINTVLSAAKNGTACLIVKGSGRAACLISDAVLLKDLKSSSKAHDTQQEALAAFIVKDLGMIIDKSYQKLLSRLHRCQKLLQEWKKEEDGKRKLKELGEWDWEAFREQYCQEWSRYKKDNAPLSEALKIEWHALQVVQKYMAKLPFCVTQKLHMVFEAAETGMCKVP